MRSGSQECPDCGACKQPVEHILLSVHHTIPSVMDLNRTLRDRSRTSESRLHTSAFLSHGQF